MGAWGEGEFENDAALDWLAEMADAGPDALRDTLSQVAFASSDDYVDVDDGNAALAAARLVRVALGGAREGLPPEAKTWLDAHAGVFTNEDAALAHRAVERVLSKGSELRELWEGLPDASWHTTTQALLAKLQTLAGDAQVPPPTTPLRAVGEREKQAIIMFMGMRGLAPTPEQLARIQGSNDLTEIRRWLGRAADAPSVRAMLDD